ncbi:MAG TPA: triose-phosphate isomerase [Microscillaceae bacterium]|jgi:triosephosphate isomerase|nr:triose-phosphate isomerase [Microscillaceae bacterium]
MRKKIIAGNWKMHKTATEALALATEIIQMANDELHNQAHLVLIPPFVHLHSLSKLTAASSRVALGAQNCHHETQGAFTGEVSAAMLAAVPVQYVIVGHSERREYFQETPAQIAQKIDLLLAHHLTPIFCCGESLAVREAGNAYGYVSSQVIDSLFHLSPEAMAQVVIAYEPIWAIGTGKTATSTQAQEMHWHIRQEIAKKYGESLALNLSILYGGSMKPDNAADLLACPDVDGGLVGGASLQSRDFINIAKAVH